ncbi:hypothetical protein RM543_18710 [Roseicyclus sp. F158]|uniref:Uncharacterized protein n=1 Tax=Tropicimonas omnivorans TaxID=3075590 RepID=A0ABU3DLU4_9RHOB|nr:hypothetical protein [Roseicyclus sp. F158]MDT0684698.1 hypothetical protein [Roseicyclus sp. F158]
MRSVFIASVAGIAGVILGAWSSDILRSGQQSSYFEANDIENYFLKNPLVSKHNISLPEIVGSSWEAACFLGVGANATLVLDGILGINSWNLKSGRIVDEGLLDYLSKVILYNADGAVYVMSFDERDYKFFAPSNCHATEKVSISRTSEEVNSDPDGYGDHLITYRITVKE